MKRATVSVTSDSAMVGRGDMSERIEARLSRSPVRSDSVREQRIERCSTVPRTKSVSSPRARSSAVATPNLPGLNGRSVRQLGHLHAVRWLRRVLVSGMAVMAVLVAATVAVPAYAQAAASPPPPVPPQTLTVSSAAMTPPVERDGYSVTAPPPVQWPTEQHTKIADGFGPRVSPCDGCSSYHLGVDFDAGRGAQVHAMAAGVVIETNDPFLAALGTHMTIQHEIDGQVVTSIYGHMQSGSTTLNVGDGVKVGQAIGLVGSTGASTGPHLHFEIHVGGSAVNPLTWLHAHIG